MKKLVLLVCLFVSVALGASAQLSNSVEVKVVKHFVPLYVKKNRGVSISGVVHNYSKSALNSIQLNYSVNGGKPFTEILTGLSVNSGKEFSFSHTVLWTPSHIGSYTIRVWVDNVNRSNDETASDTLMWTSHAVDSVATKQPLYEDFKQASCHSCYLTGPNVDSVFAHSNTICNYVEYHTDWPGVDYMNDVTDKPFVNTRVVYYNINNVPDGQLDGTRETDNWSPDTISSAAIQAEAAISSPFVISATAVFDQTNNTYSVNASVKSFIGTASTMKLRLRTVLTIDTLTYSHDQSTEDPLSAFQPPFGTTPATKGGDADSTLKYLLVFHSVAEAMLPDSLGQLLSPFTANTTQSFNFTWQKKHAWGFCPEGNCIDNGTGLGANTGNTSIYDSANNAVHITLYVQSDSSLYVFQSASIVPAIVSGVNEVTQNQYVNVYPNPATGIVNVAFSLAQAQKVNIEVYNLLGQKVYGNYLDKLQTGQHTVMFNSKGFVPGIYLVKLTTDFSSVTHKLVVE